MSQALNNLMTENNLEINENPDEKPGFEIIEKVRKPNKKAATSALLLNGADLKTVKEELQLGEKAAKYWALEAMKEPITDDEKNISRRQIISKQWDIYNELASRKNTIDKPNELTNVQKLQLDCLDRIAKVMQLDQPLVNTNDVLTLDISKEFDAVFKDVTGLNGCSTNSATGSECAIENEDSKDESK